MSSSPIWNAGSDIRIRENHFQLRSAQESLRWGIALSVMTGVFLALRTGGGFYPAVLAPLVLMVPLATVAGVAWWTARGSVLIDKGQRTVVTKDGRCFPFEAVSSVRIRRELVSVSGSEYVIRGNRYAIEVLGTDLERPLAVLFHNVPLIAKRIGETLAKELRVDLINAAQELVSTRRWFELDFPLRRRLELRDTLLSEGTLIPKGMKVTESNDEVVVRWGARRKLLITRDSIALHGFLAKPKAMKISSIETIQACEGSVWFVHIAADAADLVCVVGSKTRAVWLAGYLERAIFERQGDTGRIA